MATRQDGETDKQREVTGKDGKDLFKGMSDEELDKEIEALENKLKQ